MKKRKTETFDPAIVIPYTCSEYNDFMYKIVCIMHAVWCDSIQTLKQELTQRSVCACRIYCAWEIPLNRTLMAKCGLYSYTTLYSNKFVVYSSQIRRLLSSTRSLESEVFISEHVPAADCPHPVWFTREKLRQSQPNQISLHPKSPTIII